MLKLHYPTVFVPTKKLSKWKKMPLTDEFDSQNCLDCTKLEIIAGIYYIDFVYILANYSLQHNGERRQFAISVILWKIEVRIVSIHAKSETPTHFLHNKVWSSTQWKKHLEYSKNTLCIYREDENCRHNYISLWRHKLISSIFTS